MAFKNVLVIGAAGNLGTLILKHLASSPSGFNVSALTRKSSPAQFPSSVKVSRVSDEYPHDELVAAFTGIDVVICAISMMGMHQQYKFIDAAVAAKVKRFIPTEFGLDDLPDWLVELRPMFRTKHDVRDYLVSKESEGLEWTAIVCNAFFEMGVMSGFFQFDWSSKKAVLIDGGKAQWVATTLDTVAIAVVRTLEKAEATKNRILLVQDFRTSQREILDVVQQRSGDVWEVEEVDSEKWLDEAKDQVRGGDDSALPKLTFGSFVKGNQWEGREEFANSLLELPTKTFSEAMDAALKSAS